MVNDPAFGADNYGLGMDGFDAVDEFEKAQDLCDIPVEDDDDEFLIL